MQKNDFKPIVCIVHRDPVVVAGLLLTASATVLFILI
jgi:hypothetical protein